MKQCCRCKTERPLVEFHKDKNRMDGLAPHCKICVSDRMKRYYEAHRQDIRRKQAANYKPLLARKTTLGKYGLNLEDYDQMYVAQAGCCAICKQHHERLHVDHCHTTGNVRGLLCNNCNNGLGRFKDEPQRLLDAAEYLNRVA